MRERSVPQSRHHCTARRPEAAGCRRCPEFQLVEAVLAAGKRQDHAVLGNLFRQFGEVVAPGFRAVAAADQKEVLDRPRLHPFDNLVGHAQHRIVAETDQYFLARGVRHVRTFQGLVDDLTEIPSINVLDARPSDLAPGEEAVLVVLAPGAGCSWY